MPLFSGIISTNLEILAASRIFVPMSVCFGGLLLDLEGFLCHHVLDPEFLQRQVLYASDTLSSCDSFRGRRICQANHFSLSLDFFQDILQKQASARCPRQGIVLCFSRAKCYTRLFRATCFQQVLSMSQGVAAHTFPAALTGSPT